MKGVPLLNDLLASAEDRKVVEIVDSGSYIGFSYLMPPNVPAGRVAAWRTAFAKAMKDPALLAEAKKAKADISPKSGAESEALIGRVLSNSPKLVARARTLVGLKN